MYLSIPTQTFTMHLIIIIMLIGAFVAVFGKSNKPKKKPEPAALLTIGKAYDLLSRRIHAADTYTEIKELREQISAFYSRKYADNPAICKRRALRASLLISYSRREKELIQITNKL